MYGVFSSYNLKLEWFFFNLHDIEMLLPPYIGIAFGRRRRTQNATNRRVKV